MKVTGYIRRVDGLGRYVLAKNVMREVGFKNRDALEFFVKEDMLVLEKYKPRCVFCSSIKDVNIILEKNICESCIKEINLLKPFVNMCLGVE